MTWIIYELTNWGEREDTAILQKEIKKYLGKVEVFIPSIVNHEGLDLSLVKGYVFVNINDTPSNKLFKLEGTRFIKLLLTEQVREKGGCQRKVSSVENSYVNDLKEKFQSILRCDLNKGDTVLIRGGLYRNLEGLVVDVTTKTSSILIEMKSLKIIIEIPNFNLSKHI